jgi:4-amino-4-deoxy-L-arabinose transferase-like glycosyltransferase
LCAAVALRVAWLAYVRPIPVSDFEAYDLIARSLSRGLGYCWEAGAPTVMYPPGYPFTLSLIYRAFGPSWDAAKGFNVAFDLGAIALTYALGALLFSRLVGLLAALALAVWPSHWAYCGLIAGETEFTLLLMLLLVLAFISARKGAPTWRWAVALGVLLGLTSLVRGQALLLFLPIGAFWALRWPGQWKAAALRAGTVFAICLLVITPWTLRNRLVLGSAVLISSGAYQALWAGANPGATGTYVPTPAVADSEMRRLAISYIVNHPLRYAGYAWPKLKALIGSDDQAWYWSVASLERPVPPAVAARNGLICDYYRVILALAAAGGLLAILMLRFTSSASLPLLILGYWAGVHMVFIGVDRYHFPVTPLLALLAALTLAAPFQWKQWFRRERPEAAAAARGRVR